jgi:hypothetical protein
MPHRRRILLALDSGNGFEAWEEVAGFESSGPDDRHFVLDRDSGRVSFGDGTSGRRPPAGACFRLVYRTGGGNDPRSST